MLVGFFLEGLAQFFATLLSILPTSGSNYGFGTAYTAIDQSQLFAHFAWANNYFPITECVNAILILLALFVVMYVIRVALWIWSLIP